MLCNNSRIQNKIIMLKGLKQLFGQSETTMNGTEVKEMDEKKAFMPQEQFFNGVHPDLKRESSNAAPNVSKRPENAPRPSFVQQSAEERLEIFRSDRTRLNWNRGYRYGYSLDGNKDIFHALMDAHIGEFRSIINELIRLRTEEMDEARFMLDNGTSLLQSRLKPHVERLELELKQYTTELDLSLQREGMIEHSIKQFETGWQRGEYQFAKDYMSKKVNTELIEQTKKEVFA